MKRRFVQFAQKGAGSSRLHQHSNCLISSSKLYNLVRSTNRAEYRCSYSSDATTSHEEKIHSGLDAFIKSGSIDLEDAEQILRRCSRQDNGVEMSFEVLDRLAQDEMDIADEQQSHFNPLNFVIFNWRNQFLQNQQQQQQQVAVPLPSQVVEKIETWKSSKRLQPDTKTYAMVMEAAARCTKDHSEGVLFAESLLERQLEESMTKFSMQPTKFSFVTIMNGWVLSGRSEAPQKIEKWIDRLSTLHEEGWPDLQPEISMYNILLNGWARVGNVKKAESLLQAMLENEIPAQPDLISFTSLLNAYAKKKDPNATVRAEALLEQMHELFQSGYDIAKPNVVSYSTVIDAHARLGQGKQAEALLRKLEELYQKTQDPDWKPDAEIYNTLILAYARSNQPDLADYVLQRMYKEGITKPNERSFNAVLSAWARAGAAEKAEEILTSMHELHVDGSLECKPTVVTYNTVLNSWAKSNRKDAWKRCETILKHMEELSAAGEDEVKPNTITWNTVLGCFAKAQQIHRAENLLDDFTTAWREQRVDGKPNIRTWNTLLAACLGKKDVHHAKLFWQKMKECGVQPDIVSYNTILNCFAKSSRNPDRIQDIQTYFRFLQQDKNVSPNKITYLALLNAWIGIGKPEKAEAILRDMCKGHAMSETLAPERSLFHRVLTAWADVRSPRRAENLVLTMSELHERHGFDLKPELETYNRLLNAWAKSNLKESGERADRVLRHMEEFSVTGEDNIAPDIISYNTVLNAWANSEEPIALTKIEHLILEMIMKGNPSLTPTKESYGTWLKAIESSNEDDKDKRAREVLKTMKIHKLEPTTFLLEKAKNLTASVEKGKAR